MNKILAEPAMHRQMLAYAAALALLLAAIFFPAWLARPAGLAFAVANSWLWWNLAGAIRRYLSEYPDKFDPRDYLKPAREAAKAICKQRYQQFGCEGQGSKITAVGLTDMAQRYSVGQLAQLVN